MNNLSDVAEQLFLGEFEPLMIAIQYDAQMNRGELLSDEQAFQRATVMHLYALSKGKKIKVNIETKMVTLE